MIDVMFQRRYTAIRSICALMLREMSTTYGRSPGGYAWAILGPIAGIAVMSIAFSFALRSPPMGTSFMLFYGTGYLPLKTFQEMSQKLQMSLKFSRGLLGYPNVSYMDSILSRFTLNALTDILVFIIVMTGVIYFQAPEATVDVPRAIGAFGMIFAFAFGIGVMNCVLMSMVPVWGQIWPIVTRPLFLISGIFFLIDELPRTVQDILWWNPVAHMVMEMRAAFYGSYDALLVSKIYVYGLSGGLALMGLLMLRRYHRVILDEGA